MKLQPRDEALLQLCYEQRFLVFDHVAEHFFKGKSFQNSWKRIDELQRAGFLHLTLIEPLSDKKIIRLSRRGRKFIEESSTFKIFQPWRIAAATFAHDTLVTSVRTRLLSFWDGTWIPEGALKREDFIEVPDGLIIFPSGKRIAIEVERTTKGRSRFLKLLDRWAKIDIMMVLYISDSPQTLGYLKKHLPQGPSIIAFGLIDWRELKTSKPQVWTPAGEMDLLSVRSFE